MRTTITIDDHLLEALKRRATEEGTTVSRLIEDSVRLLAASGKSAVEDAFELVTFGRNETFTRLDTDKTSLLLEQDDVDRYGSR